MKGVRQITPRGRMNWYMVSFAVIGAWAVLRVLGGERQRQVQDLQTAIMEQAAAAADAAKAVAAQKQSAR